MAITVEDIVAAAREVVRENLAEAYTEDGLTITELSAVTGWSRPVIYRKLEAAGAYAPSGKSGPPTATHCQRGHEFAVYGKTIPGRRWQFCTECKRIRDRVAWKKEKAREHQDHP